MIRYREILRLRSKGVSVRNISYSCGCSKSTVQTVLAKAQGNGLSWPLPEEIDNTEIYRILFSRRTAQSGKAEPDFEQVNRELVRKGVTLMLCWSEYCEKALAAGAEPYQYSAFCRRYRTWADTNNVVAHLEHRPADQMMVDWAGTTMQTVDRDSGEALKVYVFVACLPYSSYLYAEGFYSMDAEAWLTAHVNAFEFFGGTTPIIVPDNLKTGVTKHTSDELVLNPSYRRLAEYYGIAVVPARVRKPKDKAAVEMGVGVITRSVIAPLRDYVFFDLAELNIALAEKVADINARPFQKRTGSRKEIFDSEEKDVLCPLPDARFEVYVTKTATVPYNYHISVDSVFYSVPFQFVKQEVEIRVAKSTVSIYADGKRIASHKRSWQRKGSYVTNPDHMPDAHKDYVEWTGKRFVSWAAEIGLSTSEVISSILASKPIEQQAYRSCRAVIALSDKYGNARLEDACARALAISHAPSYKTVKTLIATVEEKNVVSDERFAYLRGAAYFDDVEGGE